MMNATSSLIVATARTVLCCIIAVVSLLFIVTLLYRIKHMATTEATQVMIKNALIFS
jgi:hypothetical protein